LIIAYGDSSTLHQKLVVGSGQLRDVASWTRDHRGPDSFVIRALLSEDAQVADVEKELRTELDRLGSTGPTPGELERAKQQLSSFFLFGLEGNQSRAMQLANYELFYGDAALLNSEVDHYLKVTREEVQRAVARYLGPSRSNTVVVRPDAGSAPTSGGN
jgi:predicted Zn-dependent peptidase